MKQRDAEALRDYQRQATSAERAHPAEKQLLSLLLVQGADFEGDSLRVIDAGITYEAFLDAVLRLNIYQFVKWPFSSLTG